MAVCVLVVEDDPLVRFVAVQTLADAGFETIEAVDAAQALELLRRDDRTINVLLTDVRMPGRMNGFGAFVSREAEMARTSGDCDLRLF